MLQIPQNNLEPLHYLYVIPVKIDTERALDRLDGDHEIARAVHCYQNPLHSAQRTSANADTLTNFEERVILDRNFAGDQRCDRLDLFLWNGDSGVSANKVNHAAGLEDANAVSREIRNSHKCISGEQREFDFGAAIAPLPHRSHQREEN